ncbi:hypothetical protein QVD17_01467 [Tagetes erecta]|uniref:Uncharacterized protein n=1 Tax=Tagetes erecta TaxID=13708 RepID=A0AAD8LAQ0_TARER|nr:hypothetical protein QVD17_01467 [Tagetes erecta]
MVVDNGGGMDGGGGGRSYKPKMEKTHNDDAVVSKRLCVRVKDGGVTMEQKLKTLVSQNPYTFEEAVEGRETSGLYQWDDLKSTLHATDEELKSALSLVSAIEIDGYWRIVDETFIEKVLYHLVLEAESNNWSFSSLDGNKVAESLQDTYGFSPGLVRHCLGLYATTIYGKIWELNTERVCVELAKGVIKSHGKKMEIHDFMDQWSCVRMPVSLDMLEGEILIEKDGDQVWVHLSTDSNGNTLTSVSEAFPHGHQYHSRFYNQSMEKTKTRYNLITKYEEDELYEEVILEEDEVFPLDDSNQRDEDAVTLEQKLKTLLLQSPYTLDEDVKVMEKEWKCRRLWFNGVV